MKSMSKQVIGDRVRKADRDALCMVVGLGVNWMGPRSRSGICVHREVGGLRLAVLILDTMISH